MTGHFRCVFGTEEVTDPRHHQPREHPAGHHGDQRGDLVAVEQEREQQAEDDPGQRRD